MILLLLLKFERQLTAPLKYKCPLQDIWCPLQDIRSPPQNIRSPPQDIRSPLQDIRSPPQNIRSPPQDIRSPLQDIWSPLQNIRCPPQDIRSPLQDISSPLLKNEWVTRKVWRIIDRMMNQYQQQKTPVGITNNPQGFWRCNARGDHPGRNYDYLGRVNKIPPIELYCVLLAP